MYKVLIVDDEPLTRYALRKIISQNFSDLTVVDEVDNGIDAITKAESLKPDLIFMDIKMPGYNGIEASEKILQVHPKMHIIILTAYDHFNYIQKALEIGVEGYLLKPISKEVTLLKIKNILQRIKTYESKEKEREKRDHNFEAVMNLAQKDMVDQMIHHNNDDTLHKYIQFLDFKIAYGYFMCVQLSEEIERLYNSSLVRERNRTKVIHAIDRYLPFVTKYIIGSPIGNRIIIFVYDIESTNYNQYSESQMLAKHLIHKLEIVENMQVKIGIGQAYKAIGDYKTSFFEAFQAVKSVNELGTYLHFTDVKEPLIEIKYAYPKQNIEVLKEKIALKSLDECYEVAHAITNEICHSGLNLPTMKEYLTQYCYDIRSLLIAYTHKYERIVSDFMEPLMGTILLEELETIVNVQLDVWISDLLANDTVKDQTIVQTIYDYMNRNYKENIVLDDIAKAINKSSQYTSKLFKELFNVNFIDYLTQKRVDEAKRLLTTSHLNIKEISKAVGYDDSNYFCRLFKKHVGVTPKTYKRNNG